MSNEYDVVIVGGGLAGLSAGMTAARLDLRTLILTGGVPGGQLVSIERIEGVPGFPDGVPGYDLCPMAQEQADAAGARMTMEDCSSIVAEDGRWRLASADGDILARAVVVATGTALARLGVPGEERLTGSGVSHCASCDAPLLRNKIAVVVGGGDSGMQEALTIAEHAAKVLILDHGDALTGQAGYRARILDHPRIDVRFGVALTEILGDLTVSHVRIRELATGAEEELETAAVFPCIGLVPNTDLVRGLLPFDATGRIRVDAALRTVLPGLCAAGNVREASPHRAAGAMGDGAAAALAIERYLATGSWRDQG